MTQERAHIGTRVAGAFARFFALEISGAILLLLALIVALVWSNSPYAPHYFALMETKMGFAVGSFELKKSALHWINDGLMSVFFLIVGLEIKRELITGELSNRKSATLPMAAALGGMLVPALIFSACVAGGMGAYGWGVPMATDIAFSLGVLALLGSRIPTSLKVFLAALAIVDDIGATLVIALFYTKSISWPMLGAVAATLAILAVMNYSGVRNLVAYALVGLFTWFFVLKSGVHASISGVLVAAFIPARVRMNTSEFQSQVRQWVDDMGSSEDKDSHVHAIEMACEGVQSPLDRIIHLLHPWQVYGIVPIFALANAGVAITGVQMSPETTRLQLAIILGLVVGKPLGIFVCTWLAVKSGAAELPQSIRWNQILGVGMIAGIGFTMALFIADLAYMGAPYLDEVKLAILVASFVAGVVGFLLLRAVSKPEPVEVTV